ncbi:VacJ family lipoprotein [Erythrobacter sp. NFXS35]|uniref:MlaA family lipoprotein n=1 Tax=Erythrobacter sp. NFXS35 TaxID=2818436 RepID=UPI0032DF4DCC
MPNLALITISHPMLSAALVVSGPAEPQKAPALAPLTWSLQAAQGNAPPEGNLPLDEEQMPPDEANEIVVEGAYGPPEGDPAEKLNAESYRITQAVDEALIEPVAYAYRDGLPEPLRDGLGNVVRNLGEPSNALNFLLQGKVGKAFGALGRLAINSTLGLGGLIDIAGKPGIGIPYRRNGFANTMGFYGVESGPYLYLPVTGATSLRDIIGSTLDQALLPFAVGKPFNQPEYAVTYFVVNGLDQRLEVDAELAEIRASDDPYAERRDTYLAKREREIAALKGEAIEDEAQPEPAAPQASTPDQPPLSLIEQVQLTARSSPATR